MTLADLMRKGSLRVLATATPATVATRETASAATVAEVATVAVATATGTKAANGAAPDLDPDRWCWPHSDAMTGAEIERMASRAAEFVSRGLNLIDANALADRLVSLERDADDRRICLECEHLSGWANAWRCDAWRHARLGGANVAADLVQLLQRCEGFKERSHD